MLTPMQTRNTARELQENFRRLNINLDSALSDLQISGEELNRVLTMNRPDPSNVWKVRDYLEDKLKERGIEMYPFSRLADHQTNKWFSYETPWRRKS